MTNEQRIEEQEKKDREEVIRLFTTIFKDLKYTELPITATTDITVTAKKNTKKRFFNNFF